MVFEQNIVFVKSTSTYPIHEHAHFLAKIYIFHLITAPNREIPPYLDINNIVFYVSGHTKKAANFTPPRWTYAGKPSPVSNNPGYQRSTGPLGVPNITNKFSRRTCRHSPGNHSYKKEGWRRKDVKYAENQTLYFGKQNTEEKWERIILHINSVRARREDGKTCLLSTSETPWKYLREREILSLHKC